MISLFKAVLLSLRKFPTRLYQESGREPPLNLQLGMGYRYGRSFATFSSRGKSTFAVLIS